VDVISTRNKEIDKITGIGGIPRGRITEIYGPESGGKTTLTLHLIAEVQAKGGKAAFIDAEHALDPTYATNLGVNVDALYCCQPDCGEDALQVVEILINSGAFAIVVVDSVAALVPRAELDAEMDEQQMGLQGRLMSKAMRKLLKAVSRTKTSLVFINQIRDKLGVMFGSPETTTGGRALKFASSMRIDVRRISSEKKGEKIVGNETKVKIAKNKLAAPFKECKVTLMFGRGFIND
jgi:recombination protein RecA